MYNKTRPENWTLSSNSFPQPPPGEHKENITTKDARAQKYFRLKQKMNVFLVEINKHTVSDSLQIFSFPSSAQVAQSALTDIKNVQYAENFHYNCR